LSCAKRALKDGAGLPARRARPLQSRPTPTGRCQLATMTILPDPIGARANARAAALALAACAFVATQPTSAASPPAPLQVPAGNYTLDKAHASLIFKVNHLGFSNYTGRFSRFDARLQFDPARPAAARVEATIEPRSIEVDNPPGNFLAILQGADWLDAARYPEMTFRSTRVTALGAKKLRVRGDLTLHGVTRPVDLDVTYNGGYAGHPMDPQARIGFSAHGTLKRSAFGISLGIPQPGSQMGVGDTLELFLEMEFNGPPLAGSAAASAPPR
jgi:polyisoprenoid-binding protein YceI